MNLPQLSINRPVFITCLLLLIMVLGIFGFTKLPVDLFPDVTFPVVTVTTPYPGAGPSEVELLVSKQLEEQIGTISGVKTVRSINREGVSIVVAEFTLETDVKYAEQQVRDRVSSAKAKLPDDIREPTIRRIDPADQPILRLTLTANLPMAKLYDLANEVVRPRFEQINNVGLVEVLGDRKREIQVELNREKMARANLSASWVAMRLAAAGQNIPAGSVTRDDQDMVFRTLGEFESVSAIEKTAVNFFGNDVPVTIRDVARVEDGLEDAKSFTFLNGQPVLVLFIFKQSGSNSIAVANAVKKRIQEINDEISKTYKEADPKLTLVLDQARFISLNVIDVFESIVIGIFLTILVVYFFLGSMRSTLITGIAIPVSLIGAAALMWSVGFSINIMSLLAFSLAVGLLIDDAIVVRENIFRHMEMGKPPRRAALEGTLEVTMAVVAVTATILAVFGPIGFLQGVVGQFFKQFALTVCFIMIISLFDALTNAPMMSAYFGGSSHGKNFLVRSFDRFQDWLEDGYVNWLRKILRAPWRAIALTGVIVFASCYPLVKVPKTFLPTQDNGEFSVSLDMPPGTSLEKMRDVALDVDRMVRAHSEVVNALLTVGTREGDKNKAEFFISLKPFGERSMSTSEFKDVLREELKKFALANPKVKDVDYVGGGLRPFTLNLAGQDLKQVEEIASKVKARLDNHPALLDVDTSFRPGKPEYQVQVDLTKAEGLGVSSASVGRELRAQVEGVTPAVFRENGLEYDIRVRMQPDQRDLEKEFPRILVPNMNERLVDLHRVARGVPTTGPSSIDRENRGRYVQIAADLRPDGPGMGGVIGDLNRWFAPGGEMALPEGVTYRFVGQAENFQELVTSMALAALLGLVFIYLVLSSLYESFFTPFTIMLVIPLAACGAFFALWIARSSLDLYSMIGCIMLMGLATKNSIILIDYIQQQLEKGMPIHDAILEAGRVRLRPILMTSFALIAGMVPVAYGLNEVSNQRTSLGIAVIGGVLSSTLLTLIVIPAVFTYSERLRAWLLSFGRGFVTPEEPPHSLQK